MPISYAIFVVLFLITGKILHELIMIFSKKVEFIANYQGSIIIFSYGVLAFILASIILPAKRHKHILDKSVSKRSPD